MLKRFIIKISDVEPSHSFTWFYGMTVGLLSALAYSFGSWLSVISFLCGMTIGEVALALGRHWAKQGKKEATGSEK